MAEAAPEVEREARAKADGLGEKRRGSSLGELGHEREAVGRRVALTVGVDGLPAFFVHVPPSVKQLLARCVPTALLGFPSPSLASRKQTVPLLPFP